MVTKKQISLVFMLVGAASAILSAFIFTDQNLRWISAAIAAVLVIISIIIFLSSLFKKPQRSTITKLILLNSDGEQDKEWAVYAAVSLLIGKSTRTKSVDIDLGDSRYEAFIAQSHAVINRVKDDWYIEDLNTVNGVGLKKSGDDINFRIQPGKAYKIDVGDIIYISKVRLLAK